jgi:hypothetical protein
MKIRTHDAANANFQDLTPGIYEHLRRHAPSFNSNGGSPPGIWTLLAALRPGAPKSDGFEKEAC